MNIVIPKFTDSESLPNWVERCMRNGNFLHEYLRREKARTTERMRAVAADNHNRQRKKGSELNLLSVMDMRTWMRWNLAEPGLMEDKNEIKKLIRDNPEMVPWKGR